jgi:hypothetical protein
MMSGLRAAASAWALGLTALVAAERIDVTPVVADGQVVASFTAPSSYSDDTEEVVRSGLLVTFTFSVELRRSSSIWLDQTLGAVTVASSVKFDNLLGVYQVSKLADGQVVWSKQTRDGSEVRQWMTTFEKVALMSRTPLEPNAEYYVQVRLHTSPKRTFSLLPWLRETASGRADFTFIR